MVGVHQLPIGKTGQFLLAVTQKPLAGRVDILNGVVLNNKDRRTEGLGQGLEQVCILTIRLSQALGCMPAAMGLLVVRVQLRIMSPG